MTRPRARDLKTLPLIDAALPDLVQGGYLDLQCIDPFRCEAHSAAHELSNPATLLEQHLQYALLPPVRLHPDDSQQGDTAGPRRDDASVFSFPAGKRFIAIQSRSTEL